MTSRAERIEAVISSEIQRLSLSRHHQPTDKSLSKLQEMAKGRETWRAAVHGVTKSRTRLNNKMVKS